MRETSFLLNSILFPELTIHSPFVQYNFVSHRLLPRAHLSIKLFLFFLGK